MKKTLLLSFVLLLAFGCKKETDDSADNGNNNNNNGNTNTETVTCRITNSKSYDASGTLITDATYYYTGARPDSIVSYFYTPSGSSVTKTIYEHLPNNECNIRTPSIPNSGYRWVKFDANYNEVEAKSFYPNGTLMSYGNSTFQCD